MSISGDLKSNRHVRIIDKSKTDTETFVGDYTIIKGRSNWGDLWKKERT